MTAPPRPWDAAPEPSAILPRSVRWCQEGRESGGEKGWTRVWLNRGTGQLAVAPFGCGSWRCRWCGPRVFRRDRDRLLEGLERQPEWVGVTLTYPHRGRRWAAFRRLYRDWTLLAKRLRRRWPGLVYVAVAERHRDGYPHLHALLWAPGLPEDHRAAGELGPLKRKGAIVHPTEAAWTRRVLRPHAVEAGFGTVVESRLLDVAEAAARYMTKGLEAACGMARHAAELVGSPSSRKGYQVPLNAPPHFRRIRSSRGLIAPQRERSAPGASPWVLALLKAPAARVEAMEPIDQAAVIASAIRSRAEQLARRAAEALRRAALAARLAPLQTLPLPPPEPT